MSFRKSTRFCLSVLLSSAFVGASQPSQCTQVQPTKTFEGKVLVDQTSIAGQDCTETADVLQVNELTHEVQLNYRHFLLKDSLRKSCNLRVPIDVNEGHRTIVKATHLRARAALSAGSSGRIQARILLTGNQDFVLEESLDGPAQKSIELLQDPTVAILEGECSKDVMLGLNSNLLLKNREAGDSLSLDSIGLILETEPCELESSESTESETAP